MYAWQATVQDEAGNVVPLPVVTVYNEDGATLANIFNQSGAPLTNPLTGTLEGFVQFLAADGRYQIEGASGADRSEVWHIHLGSEMILPSYSAAVTEATKTSLNYIRAVVYGNVLTWVRSVGGTCLGGGWTPSNEATPEHWGAIGDGVANDTAPVQSAVSSNRPAIFRDGAVYNIASPIIVPANKTINMNGSTILRGFKNGWAMENISARIAGIDAGIHLSNVSFADGGTNASRGNFLMMSGVSGLTIDGLKVRGSSPNLAGENLGAWSLYCEGNDVSISGVDIDNSACGLYSDGLHFGVCQRLTVASGYNIVSGDDAIALHHPPAAWDNIHANGVANGISIGSGYVSSAAANGIRIGAWPNSGNLTAWNNVTIGPVVFGTCGAHPIRLEDTRDEATNKSGNINIIVGSISSPASNRLLSIVGNPDGGDILNALKRNFSRVTINGVVGAVNNSIGQFIEAFGVDELNINNTQITAIPGMVTTSPRIRFRQIGRLTISNASFLTETTGIAMHFGQVTSVRMNNVDLLAGGASIGVNVVNSVGDTSAIYVSGGTNRNSVVAYSATVAGTLNEAVVSGTDVTATTLTTAAFRAASRFVWSIPSGAPAV